MPLLYISLLCGGKQISLLYFATIRLVFIHLILTFVGFFNSEFLKLSRNLNLTLFNCSLPSTFYLKCPQLLRQFPCSHQDFALGSQGHLC